MKVGIQGGAASYHEAAARQLNDQAEIVYCATFAELFKALVNKQIDRAVTAIANNRVQFIADPYERLTAPESPYEIVGETYLRVEHVLLAPDGATIEGIQEVHSQAPAIGQCSHYLEEKLPDAHIVEETDTALAAMFVAEENKPHKAAIASRAAAELYGLKILAENIQNDRDNITRFLEVVLKNTVQPSTAANKTTILLQTPQVAGALVGALLPFRAANINLSSLQSQLIPNTAFEMQFFVEFEAGLQDPTTQDVLKQLKANNYKVDILGSYKMASVPINKEQA